MTRKRVRLTVEFDLDPLPGTNHTEEDARKWLLVTLTRAIPHYNPVVLIDDRPDSRDAYHIRNLIVDANAKCTHVWFTNGEMYCSREKYIATILPKQIRGRKREQA